LLERNSCVAILDQQQAPLVFLDAEHLIRGALGLPEAVAAAGYNRLRRDLRATSTGRETPWPRQRQRCA
jgi:hypothetical protein